MTYLVEPYEQPGAREAEAPRERVVRRHRGARRAERGRPRDEKPSRLVFFCATRRELLMDLTTTRRFFSRNVTGPRRVERIAHRAAQVDEHREEPALGAQLQQLHREREHPDAAEPARVDVRRTAQVARLAARATENDDPSRVAERRSNEAHTRRSFLRPPRHASRSLGDPNKLRRMRLVGDRAVVAALAVPRPLGVAAARRGEVGRDAQREQRDEPVGERLEHEKPVRVAAVARHRRERRDDGEAAREPERRAEDLAARRAAAATRGGGREAGGGEVGGGCVVVRAAF